MPQEWTYRVAACFDDARPPLDVKFSIEKRAVRLMFRVLDQPDVLLYRGADRSYTVIGTTTLELRLDAAFETHNRYCLQLDCAGPGDPSKEATWAENMRRSFDKYTVGFARTEDRTPSSPERYRQVMEETTALENAPLIEDTAGIRSIQESILNGLRGGKSFFTANKEGGTMIRFTSPNFVLQDYGESNDREEFTDPAAFLARLRKFYEWGARYPLWYPHFPPELEAWRYIQSQLK